MAVPPFCLDLPEYLHTGIDIAAEEVDHVIAVGNDTYSEFRIAWYRPSSPYQATSTCVNVIPLYVTVVRKHTTTH